MVLSSALDNGYIFITLVAILASVVSAYYYLALVKQIFFHKTDYILNPVLENLNLNVTIEGTKAKTNSANSQDGTNPSQAVDMPEQVNINAHNIKLSSSLTATISILTLIILLFMLIPQEWLNMANILALILFNC